MIAKVILQVNSSALFLFLNIYTGYCPLMSRIHRRLTMECIYLRPRTEKRTLMWPVKNDGSDRPEIMYIRNLLKLPLATLWNIFLYYSGLFYPIFSSIGEQFTPNVYYPLIVYVTYYVNKIKLRIAPPL